MGVTYKTCSECQECLHEENIHSLESLCENYKDKNYYGCSCEFCNDCIFKKYGLDLELKDPDIEFFKKFKIERTIEEQIIICCYLCEQQKEYEQQEQSKEQIVKEIKEKFKKVNKLKKSDLVEIINKLLSFS